MLNFKKGLTILEVIIVLSILGFLIAIVLPSFKTMRDNQILKSAISNLSSSLNKAKSQTLASVDSSEYGVHFEFDKIIIFKGQTFSSSDANNENILISPPAFISAINLTDGVADLYFNKLSGTPDRTGTITISISSLSKIITISATGAISVN